LNKGKATTFLPAAAITLGLIMTCAPAFSHHAFSAEFDVKKPITLTGTVTKVEWTNPHARFYVSVTDESGGTTVWDFELASPNGLMRRLDPEFSKARRNGYCQRVSGERRLEDGQRAICQFGRWTQDLCWSIRRRGTNSMNHSSIPV